MNALRRWFRRYLEYDAARRGLRALCNGVDCHEALRYARSCGLWRSDVLRYLSRAVCYGFPMPEARDLHAQGVPEDLLLSRAERRESVNV